ncbi:MAG: PEP-CTERM sorting domain-containing protein [Methanoregulaceae archaeon]|nr:PEP-CTERM sorting domain-containing protein [Methanoregulaceae archaeon]
MKFLLVLGGSVVATTAMSASFFDNFDRPDAGDLGSNWTNVAGTIGIVNNQAMAPSTSTNVALVTGYSDTAANTAISFDVSHTSGTVAFAAAVLGYTSNSSSIFVKVQDNLSDGTFNRAFFYIGDNGSGGGFGFDDMTPFTSARVYVWFSGTVASLGIDTNFDMVLDQTYSRDYGTSAWGTGAGLSAYGDAAIDNYGINAVPEPATLAALGLGVAALLRRRRA